MNLDPAKLLRRISLGEDSHLEMKAVYFRGSKQIDGPRAGKLSDELASFANAAGGLLILGVDDKTHQVEGIPRERLDAVEQWLGNLAETLVEPPLVFHSTHLELPDTAGDWQAVIAIEIPRSLWVHRSAGGYFHRVGSSKRQLSTDYLARLIQQRSQARIIRFDEQSVPEARFEDLAEDLVLKFIQTLFEEQESAPPSALNVLKRLHLLTRDADGEVRPSVSGVLLCSRRPDRWLPSAYIQAVVYRGRVQDSAHQIDARDIFGPLDQQIREGLAFVLKNQRMAAVKTPEREEFPQFSKRAVFEAIVNAVVHRDYAIPAARIRLFLFEDRLEVRSPGTIPNSMTVESMTELSFPRNELITNLLGRFYPVEDKSLRRKTLMDKRGDGVKAILSESLSLSGKKPIYKLIEDLELKLTIFAANPVSAQDANWSESSQ